MKKFYIKTDVMNQNTVKERLKLFIKSQNISARQFCLGVGLSEGYVNAISKSIQPDVLSRISFRYPMLNTEWLMLGNGEMLKNNVEKSVVVEEKSSIHTVPLLPISAQGGSFNDFVISVRDIDCERVVSPIKSAEYAMPVLGDSMSPEYPDGCQIFVRRINEHAFIEWGKVYVLDTCNGSIIKRIYPSQQENSVRCCSINPDYPPFDVCLEDVYGFYRVLLAMSLK